MRIVSWNVLLREYEQKYNPRSRILNRYTEEQRITLILDFVLKTLETDTIVCLQECSVVIVNTLQNRLQNTPFECFSQAENDYYAEENEELKVQLKDAEDTIQQLLSIISQMK